MRYQISITKKNIITAILFVIGLLFLSNGILSYYKYHHAVPLEALNKQTCKKGIYVVGNINTYIGINLMGNNRFYGVSNSLIIPSGKTYDFYTIPIDQNAYIRVMVYDKTTKKKLEDFVDGQGEPFPFKGEIVDAPIEINDPWYARIEDFHTEDVIESFVIKEAKIEKKKNILYLGITLLFIAMLLFFDAGGFKNIIVKEPKNEKVTKNTQNAYANSYNKDNELLFEKWQLQSLEQKLNSLKRKAVIRFPILFIGVYILNKYNWWAIKLGGLLFIFTSLKGIWNYFINSDNTAAMLFAKKFCLETLTVKINKCQNNIEKIKEAMGNSTEP